jgi:hypothetical protein
MIHTPTGSPRMLLRSPAQNSMVGLGTRVLLKKLKKLKEFVHHPEGLEIIQDIQ